MNDLQILDFVYLALKDPHTTNQETFIRHSLAYGRRFGVTIDDIERFMNKRFVDLIGEIEETNGRR